LLAESRVAWELPRFLLDRRLPPLPRGDGHAVMVIPGFGASDLATHALRQRLQRLGYHAVGWKQGRNLGMRRALGEALSKRIALLHEGYGPVSLIGWSLGGVFAREFARARPEQIRRVITLGSPIGGHPEANNMNALFRRMNPKANREIDWAAVSARAVAPPVPCTAVYTRSDGIVSWRCCLELPAANTENVEVRGTHMGLTSNLEVLAVIADRLHR
jgi:pimeloyl-ACP methyl ester carboxylesterase